MSHGGDTKKAPKAAKNINDNIIMSLAVNFFYNLFDTNIKKPILQIPGKMGFLKMKIKIHN
jgi:hypothetical protein